MNILIKKFVKFLPEKTHQRLRRKYWNWKNARLKVKKERVIAKEWIANGRPVPPPHSVKSRIVAQYAKKTKVKILVETGTYLGAMVEAQLKNFELIHSIELSVDLHGKVKEKFRENENVVLWQGDSGKVLPEVLANLDTPALFWLDGHYSAGITAKGDKECPILEEIDAIFGQSQMDLEHVLLIDDARCFTGENDYPELKELESYVMNKKPDYTMEVADDVIRFIPAK